MLLSTSLFTLELANRYDFSFQCPGLDIHAVREVDAPFWDFEKRAQEGQGFDLWGCGWHIVVDLTPAPYQATRLF